MESQHEGVAALLDACEERLQAWRRTADAADGEALATALASLVAALVEHLACEERDVLPLMARHITPEEWEEFTERGMESIPRSMMFLGFGMMLYEGDPEVIAIEMRRVPGPLRRVLPPLGRRAFRRYARALHGTPTPPTGRELTS